MQKVRTAKIVAEAMQGMGYEVATAVGVTGVVCVLKNGAGPTVMLRTHRDAHSAHQSRRLAWHVDDRVPAGEETAEGAAASLKSGSSAALPYKWTLPRPPEPPGKGR